MAPASAPAEEGIMESTTSNPEKRGPGRPRKFGQRVRTSLELSQEVLDAVDRARGTDSRAIEIERVLRKAYGLPEGGQNENH